MPETTHILSRGKIFQLLSDHREEILKFSVTSLAVFGSAARDELADDSDVDILIELKNITFRNYMHLKFYLEDLFHREVDLVPKDCIKKGLEKYILAEAIDVPGF
ncbi:MAG: nucleotidyltransferase family protein [candidate division Zixibacteria bacterium]|nr:nucleotidyltransferase family protein [Candidatus Tariuqbacter arcticus]